MKRIFYHPELMPTDKAKMLLAVYTSDGIVKSYVDHYAAIVTRIRSLIDEAIEDGENVTDLIENQLNITVYPGNSIALAHQVLASPQIQSLLTQTATAWSTDSSKTTKARTFYLNANPSEISVIDHEGEEHTQDLVEEMTLRHYLEQASMIDEE